MRDAHMTATGRPAHRETGRPAHRDLPTATWPMHRPRHPCPTPEWTAVQPLTIRLSATDSPYFQPLPEPIWVGRSSAASRLEAATPNRPARCRHGLPEHRAGLLQ